MGDLSTEKQTHVVVTGFGPFGNHNINASWVAVQELEKLGLSSDVQLITREIPVEYDTVKSIVPKLWQQYKPKLMIHVGVSGIAKELTLEQQAHNDGYDKYDVRWQCPPSKCCVEGAPDTIVSKLDMVRVRDAVRSSIGIDCIVSHDPGRYLCDFIYYTSLNIDNKCTCFIHVPPLHKPYSAKQLADGIRVAILAMLEQL